MPAPDEDPPDVDFSGAASILAELYHSEQLPFEYRADVEEALCIVPDRDAIDVGSLKEPSRAALLAAVEELMGMAHLRQRSDTKNAAQLLLVAAWLSAMAEDARD